MGRAKCPVVLLLHGHSDLDAQLRISDWRARAHSFAALAALVFPLPCGRVGGPRLAPG